MVILAWLAALAMALASGTQLVLTEHYGWAWIPLLLAASLVNKWS